MHIGLQGIQLGQMAGAAGATKLQFQSAPALMPVQSTGIQKTESATNFARPADNMMDAAAVITAEAIATTESGIQTLKNGERRLADAMGTKTEAFWRLASRFLSSSDAFALRLTNKKTRAAHARTVSAKIKQPAAKVAPAVSAPKVKTEKVEARRSEPTENAKPAKAKTNSALALMGNGIDIVDVSLELPGLPKTTPVASSGTTPTQTAPKQSTELQTDAAVAQATGPFKSVVPYSVSQFERARIILGAAGVAAKNDTTLPFTKVTSSPAVSRIDPRKATAPKKARASQRAASWNRSAKPARTFKRSHAVGRSPAFLVGNIRTRRARKVEPAQIVRVAITENASRKIIFARVPGTRGEYRFAGIERVQNKSEARRSTTPHALAAPHAERSLQPTALGLAPPAVGGGETAYTMPEPRELRADERQVLMSMLKDQLAKGPASLGDPAIREQFNAFMFSNTVGEMSHYVTADQWNAMVRATVLYAARAVLPFSNNSITGTAAEYLFDKDDAEERYDAWMDHFGISGLSDITMVDTFADDDRTLTMPEYLLKGIMDYLADLAPLMHAYDEDVLPLPFTTELSLQWETIGFIHDPAISNDKDLISAATAFADEIAALDVQAAQHFIELVLLSTRVSTDSIQGVWNEDQAIALVDSLINAGLGDVVDRIGRNSDLPRRPRRLIAIAKEARNAEEDSYELGLEHLTRNLADAIQSGTFSIEPEEEELRLN